MTHGTARLYLAITVNDKTTLYAVDPIVTDPRVAPKAWRLTSEKNSYVISVDDRGFYDCDCQDSIYRSFGHCKHCTAARSVGLLPQPWHPREKAK